MRFEAKIIDTNLIDTNLIDTNLIDTNFIDTNFIDEARTMPAEFTEADLPDDLRELASQLSADADRLTELYPASPKRDLLVQGDAPQPDSTIIAAPWRWVRVAAAVAVLA